MTRSTDALVRIARIVAAIVAAVAFAVAAFAAACGGDSSPPVGQACTPDLDAGVQPLYEPAPECPSNVCAFLSLPGAGGVCTTRCDKDDDCVGDPDAGCEGGFTCTVATVSGPECCLGYCYCRDVLVIPDGGIQLPRQCEPDNQQNHCCNLPGRGSCEE